MRLLSTLAAVAALSATAECLSGSVLPLRRRDNKQSNPAPMTATEYAAIFDVEVQFGDQSFMLLVDSGSSDTWVVQDGFRCIDKDNHNLEQPQSACGYKGSYHTSSTFRPIRNQTFGVKYGTGISTGFLGYEDLTMGGITVKNQTVGIVNSTDDDVGDGLQGGILGLGYPALTSAHPGDNYPNETLVIDRVIYEPFFQSMYKRGLVEPWFSMALERLPTNTSTGHGGYLGLGELPPVAHSDKWATVPVELTSSIPKEYYQDGKPVFTYWSVSVDAVTWGPGNGSSSSTVPTTNTTTNSTSFQVVVDSGNGLNVFPVEIADEINSAFDPPGLFDKETNTYAVDCNARAPTYGVVVGGQTFWHDQRDMIVQSGDGSCTSGVMASLDPQGVLPYFLGDTFLKNVVSVYDVGKDEMRFAARTGGANSTTGGGNSTTGGSGSGSGSGSGNGSGSGSGIGSGSGGPPPSAASSLDGVRSAGYLGLVGLVVALAL